MIQRLIIFLLSGLMTTIGYAESYQVVVYGKLVDGAGNGISGKTIYISSSANARFKVDTKTSTYVSGEFKEAVSIPDTIREGVLLLSYENCDGKKIISEQRFSKEKNYIEVKLVYCERNLFKECASEVLTYKINDSVSIARVKSKGTPPFKTTWSTGQEGDSIRFNPADKIKICVRVVDSKGCVSEACATVITPQCQAIIKRDGRVLYASLVNADVRSYSWSNGSNDARIEVKENGEYCVKILGMNGCESKACLTITDLGPTCSAEIVAERIQTNDQGVVPGVKLSIKADFPLNFIKWSTGDTSRMIIVRSTGEYCASISDNTRCKAYICKKVEVPGGVDCSLSIVQEKLPVASTDAVRKIKLYAKTPFKPVLYYWSTGDTTQSITVAKSGEYCVTVSDGVNCKVRECIKIELDPLPRICSVVIIVKPVSSKEVKLVPRVAGQVPMKYKWSTGSNDESISVTKTGKYCVTVYDGVQCESTDCVEIEIEGNNGLSSPGADKNKVDTNGLRQSPKISLNIFPNPTPDAVIYQVTTEINHDGTISVMNLYGKLVYKEKIAIQYGAGRGDLDLSFLPPGVYQIVFEQQGIMKTNKLVIGR